MSQEMDQFIAEVYGTGQDPLEKIAAENLEEQQEQLFEMEKAAAVEAFTDKVAELGLNLDEYADDDIEHAFNEFIKEAIGETWAGRHPIASGLLTPTAAMEQMKGEVAGRYGQEALEDAPFAVRHPVLSQYVPFTGGAIGTLKGQKYLQELQNQPKQASLEEQYSEEDLIKQAWMEADAIGRKIAQDEFLDHIKKVAKGEAELEREIGKGVAHTEAAKGVRPATMREAQSTIKGAPKSTGEAVSRSHRQAKQLAKAEKSFGTKGLKWVEKGVKKPGLGKIGPGGKALIGLGAAGTAAGAAGAAGGGYALAKHLKKKQDLQEQSKAAAYMSETPFLDDAIQHAAMAIGISSGVITPDGECNLDKEGNLIYEPSWTEEVELEMPKTAMDQELYGLALQHLENLGYPVQWEEE